MRFLYADIFRVNEVSYLTSVRELLDTWSLVSRSSSSQQLTWFPFTELVVITHTSELDRWVSFLQVVIQVLIRLSWPLHSPCSRKCLARQAKRLRQ